MLLSIQGGKGLRVFPFRKPIMVLLIYQMMENDGKEISLMVILVDGVDYSIPTTCYATKDFVLRNTMCAMVRAIIQTYSPKQWSMPV